jgi:hypothetical protein
MPSNRKFGVTVPVLQTHASAADGVRSWRARTAFWSNEQADQLRRPAAERGCWPSVSDLPVHLTNAPKQA